MAGENLSGNGVGNLTRTGCIAEIGRRSYRSGTIQAGIIDQCPVVWLYAEIPVALGFRKMHGDHLVGRSISGSSVTFAGQETVGRPLRRGRQKYSAGI